MKETQTQTARVAWHVVEVARDLYTFEKELVPLGTYACNIRCTIDGNPATVEDVNSLAGLTGERSDDSD